MLILYKQYSSIVQWYIQCSHHFLPCCVWLRSYAGGDAYIQLLCWCKSMHIRVPGNSRVSPTTNMSGSMSAELKWSLKSKLCLSLCRLPARHCTTAQVDFLRRTTLLGQYQQDTGHLYLYFASAALWWSQMYCFGPHSAGSTWHCVPERSSHVTSTQTCTYVSSTPTTIHI